MNLVLLNKVMMVVGLVGIFSVSFYRCTLPTLPTLAEDVWNVTCWAGEDVIFSGRATQLTVGDAWHFEAGGREYRITGTCLANIVRD